MEIVGPGSIALPERGAVARLAPMPRESSSARTTSQVFSESYARTGNQEPAGVGSGGALERWLEGAARRSGSVRPGPPTNASY